LFAHICYCVHSFQQVGRILNPLAQLDGEREDCVYDGYGRAFCTENPWSNAGNVPAVAALLRP
jgi:hypothetical protein